MPPAADRHPPASSAPAPAAHSLARHEFVSSDCSVRVRGRIVQHGPPGQIDGIQLELDSDDGLSIRYPQLVSVRIRPEEQTLWSINAGERLLTLATPLLPPPADDDDDHAASDKHRSSSAIDDEDDEDEEGEPAHDEHKAAKPTVVTLHEGFLPASEADHLESSPLYSSTFQVLIDGPTFPPPHFDPASLAPPTPAVRPHDGTTTTTTGGGGLSSGMLNSPTIQRALLSPLLSPQRRAASQGSDASVPPLSIGLSRTSRASFSAPDRPPAPANPSTSASRGLAALIVPPSTSTTNSSSTSSTATTTPPTLGGTLTGALSSAAKRTAEELVALRRTHDAYVRRAKAELEILEARIDNFDGHVAGKEEGIVRGFRTRDERDARARQKVDAGASVSRSRERGRTPVADVVEGGGGGGGEAARRSSASGSRERPMSRGRGSVERAGPAPHASSSASASASSSSVPRATNKDEDVSSLIRAQDEREEDERGRSRSRARRDEAGPPSTQTQAHAHAHAQAAAAGSASQRSRSRTKALAEANAKVLEDASTSASASGSTVRQGESSSRERGEAGEPGSGSASASAESRGRGRGPRKGENIPATLEEEDEEDDEGAADRRGRDRNRDHQRDGNTTTPRGDPRGGSNGFLSPSSAGAGQPTTRGSNGGGGGSSTGTTPTFHAAGHPLVAIPESEELSVTPSDKGDAPEPAARSERLGERAQRERQKSAEQDEEEDQPFEMDEDVDVDAFDLGSPQPRTVPLDSPSLEVGNGPSHGQQHQQQSAVSSSFRPGSFQRASALSASYNALLATHSPKMRASPHSPAVGLPVSPSVSATRAYGSPASRASPAPRAAGEQNSALPPFSPPEAHRQTATSAREDAQAALASSTLEHSRLGRSSGGGGGPDPRDVRRGEQKIRDVLAMDVPSHRPLHSMRRRASVDTPNAATYQADDDGTDSAETSEEDDVVPDLGGGSSAAGLAMSGLTSPNSTGGPRGAQQQQQHQQHQVGSLPIALGRPSSVNAALSSWRPDPERDWAQARERKTSLAQGREQPLVPPIKGASSSSAASGARTIPTAGGGAAVLPVEPPSAALEIESPATPRPTSAGGTGISGMPGTGASSGQHGQGQAQGQGASVAMSSSLAQSLRNAPASFGRRAEAEDRNGAQQQQHAHEQGHVDRGALSSGTAAAEGVTVADEEGAEGEEEEEDDDDDGAFVPPHLVAERRERKDERWLSRSIGGSKR
ncbi:hypothetical protein JCM3775_003394 [Rhodotorula graminis]